MGCCDDMVGGGSTRDHMYRKEDLGRDDVKQAPVPGDTACAPLLSHGDMYFEKQIGNHCWVHALNNALGRKELCHSATLRGVRRMVDGIPELSRLHSENPQFARDGNYRWRVIGRYIMETTGLIIRGCGNTWTHENIEGLLTGCESAIITYRGHAVAIRKIDSAWYYLDSMSTGPRGLQAGGEGWTWVYETHEGGTLYKICTVEEEADGGDLSTPPGATRTDQPDQTDRQRDLSDRSARLPEQPPCPTESGRLRGDGHTEASAQLPGPGWRDPHDVAHEPDVGCDPDRIHAEPEITLEDIIMGEADEVEEGEQVHLTGTVDADSTQRDVSTRDGSTCVEEDMLPRLTVATLNVETLYREAGGYGHSVRRVRDVMDDNGFDMIFLTETNATKIRMDQLRRAMAEQNMYYRLGGTPDDVRGVGVMLVWRARAGITVRAQKGKYGKHEGGRGLAAVVSGWGGGKDFLLVGFYGVSNPRDRREEAKEVWKWGSRAISHYRARPSRADGRVVALGDFNAVLDPVRDRGVLADQKRRQREEGDPDLALFVHINGLRDVAEIHGNRGGEAFAFTFKARGGSGGESRLDRIYVGGAGSEGAVVDTR